jgi:2-keto-4-pentenoate hydratase
MSAPAAPAAPIRLQVAAMGAIAVGCYDAGMLARGAAAPGPRMCRFAMIEPPAPAGRRTFPMNSLDSLAQHLAEAHRGKARFETLTLQGSRLSLAQAYQAQDRYVALLRQASGDAVVGYKIGLTSQVMQQMCGLDTPIHGRILASTAHRSGVGVRPGDFGRLGMEFEIAVKIGRDVTSVPATAQDMAPFVEAVGPAIELIDDRAADYASLDAPSLVADNSWNAGVVLGPWTVPPADLAERGGRVLIDGVQADRGRVGDALDHPFEPVRWLAAQLAQSGTVLRAGMIVMTGSIVKTRFPDRTGHWRYEVDGLGEVEVAIDAESR